MDEKLTGIFLSIRGGLARAVAGIVPPKEIEDIVQETYVRACQTRAGEQITSPRSFMFKTAKNIALNHINRSESRLSQSYDDMDGLEEHGFSSPPQDMIDQVCIDEEFALLCDAVRKLPVQCRRVFVLKKVYGHSQKEISHLLNISEKTVENHITNGVKRCRQYVQQQQSRDQIDRKSNQGVIRSLKGARGE